MNDMKLKEIFELQKTELVQENYDYLLKKRNVEKLLSYHNTKFHMGDYIYWGLVEVGSIETASKCFELDLELVLLHENDFHLYKFDDNRQYSGDSVPFVRLK